MRSRRVVFTGAVLARLYTACSSRESPFDGLLFGSSYTHSKDLYDDNQEAVTEEETVVIVTNVIICFTECSFYDGAGKCNHYDLDNLRKNCEDPLIGWFYFSTDFTSPTSTHKTVTHNLSSVGSGSSSVSPNLFCLFSAKRENNNATISSSYKAYVSVDAAEYPEMSSDDFSRRVLVEAPITVQDIGDQRGEDRYMSMMPSSVSSLNNGHALFSSRINDIEFFSLDIQNQIIQKLQQRCADLMKEFLSNLPVVTEGVDEIYKLEDKLEELKRLCSQ